MRRLVLVLGSGRVAKRMSDLIKKKAPDFIPVFTTYKKSVEKKSSDLIMLDFGKEIDQIKAFLKNDKIEGVINRYDSYIPLHGKIVDAFLVPGPGYEAIKQFKDKAKFHKLMKRVKLGNHRPKTEEIQIEDLATIFEKKPFPFVLKPSIGSKSRGVFVVRLKSEYAELHSYYQAHFNSNKVRTTGLLPTLLVEEYIDGHQLTAASYVDRDGKVNILSFERVLQGKDVGQKHQQLVYRATPARIKKKVKEQVSLILQNTVTQAGLKSTMLHPEFLVTREEKVYVLEINVRVGGFRGEMLKHAYGLDLDSVVIDLALDKVGSSKKRFRKSCTGVEIWRDRSGTIKEFAFINTTQVKEYKQNFFVGDQYAAPPRGDVPLANFFVVTQKDSLSAAIKIISSNQIVIE